MFCVKIPAARHRLSDSLRTSFVGTYLSVLSVQSVVSGSRKGIAAATLPIEWKHPVSASAFAFSFYMFSKAPRNFFGIEADSGVEAKAPVPDRKALCDIARLQDRSVPAFHKALRDCSMSARPPHGSVQAVTLSHLARAYDIALPARVVREHTEGSQDCPNDP